MRITENNRRVILPIIGMITVILAWEILPRVFNTNVVVFPTFSKVIEAFICFPQILINATLTTLFESIFGLFLGFLIATIFSIIFFYSLTFERMFLPFLILFRSIPIIVLAPLLKMQIDSVIGVSIVMASIISFFPILINMISGIRSISKEAKELFITLNATKTQFLIYLCIPLAMRDVFNGLKIGATFAVIGAIVAEFVTTEKGIGARIADTAYNSQTDDSFAAILCAAGIGTMLFYSVEFIAKKMPYINQKLD